jgi:hypothetical protein
MAQQLCLSSLSLDVSQRRAFRNNLSTAAGFLFVLNAILLGAVSAGAQTPPQQQYVYASTSTSEVAGFHKVPNGNGALESLGTLFSDSRFHGGPMAIDGQSRFLFILDPNGGIWMFSIQSNGTLTVAPSSPFFPGTTGSSSVVPTSPVCLAAEKSGQFLYVGYRDGSIIGFQINADALQLRPIPIQEGSKIQALPIGMLTDPKGAHLYVAGLGSNPLPGQPSAGINLYSIDTTDPVDQGQGQITFVPNGGSNNPNERSLAIDPRGQFLFDGWGSNRGSIESSRIDPSNGTATAVSAVSLDHFPSAVLLESTGKFLYVQLAANIVVYSIDSMGVLTTVQATTSTLNFQRGSAAADSQGPYIYSLWDDGVHAFHVDLTSGQLDEIGTPVSIGTGVGGLAISGAPVQAVSGPGAALFLSASDFGQVTVGQSSEAHQATLTNTGDQPLSLSPPNPVAVSGANASDFTITANCPPLLQPRDTCTIGIVFTPTAAGPRQANLTATDNAPGSPQSVPLTGTGVPPQPAVTLMPGSLSFPTTAQGATSASQIVTVASSGAATLHISSVLLSGANPGDFNIVTNGCSGAYPVNASCTVSVTFSPFGDGLRTASISIADDAPNSPQSVQLSGTGSGQPVSRPAINIAPATVSFGAVTPVTQGTTIGPQTLTVTSAGSAPLHISSILLGGANREDFSMTNGCTAPVYATNATCSISVTFAPLQPGPRSGAITITDDASGSPQTIAVNGNVNPAFTLGAPGGLSATVTAGQTATYNLKIIPAPDFVGTVSFSCTGAPLAATCTVPQSLPVNGNVVPFTVRVATSGSAMMTPFFRAPPLEPFPGLRLFPLLTLFVLVLLVCSIYGNLRRNAPGRRMIYSGLFAGLIVIALFDVAGCGGGSSAAQSAPITQQAVTPQGTSTISVTLTAITATGKQLPPPPPTQLTLIVK